MNKAFLIPATDEDHKTVEGLLKEMDGFNTIDFNASLQKTTTKRQGAIRLYNVNGACRHMRELGMSTDSLIFWEKKTYQARRAMLERYANLPLSDPMAIYTINKRYYAPRTWFINVALCTLVWGLRAKSTVACVIERIKKMELWRNCDVITGSTVEMIFMPSVSEVQKLRRSVYILSRQVSVLRRRLKLTE